MATLNILKKNDPEIYDVIMILDKNGKTVADSENGSIVGTSYGDREYFKKAINGEKYWNDVIISRITNKPATAFCEPIKNSNGNIVGVLVVGITFDSLANIAKDIHVGESGYAYMIDNKGLTLYHPTTDKILKENLIEANRENKELYDILKKMANAETGSGFYTYNKVEKINSYENIGRWSIAVTVPVKEYMVTSVQIRNITLILALIFISIGSIIAIVASNSIIKPIRHFMELMYKAENGDLTIEAKIKSKDELGELAVSFNNMILGQKKAINTVMITASEIAASAQEASGASEEMAGSAESQTAATEELANTMVQMNKSIENIAEGITEIANNMENVAESMEQMEMTAGAMTKIVDNTSATITDVTSSLQEMNASIEIVAMNSVNASNEAVNTVKVAQEGKKTVQNTIDEMDKINKAMDNLTTVIKGLGKAAIQIGDIVEVIDDIAEQTNLLALNAAIEAARAGEHGKGFAVVAGAIGNLAEKSGEATKDITNLIKQIRDEVDNAVETTNAGAIQVESGVNLVRSTGNALDKIFQAIDSTTNLINEIASSTAEQSRASKSIMEAVEEVNTLSIQVSAAVEKQITAVSEVAKAVVKVNGVSQGVASAAEEQSAATEEVLSTTSNLSDMANEVSSGSEEVASTASQLAEQASNLMDVVNKFKIS
jgi:methyl-accepting chemotaxis protein